MAQFNFEEEITSQNNTAIDFINVMTGDKDRQKQLYFQLKNSIDKAKRIDIIVSFLMESGVRLLLKDLRKAIDKDVPIRILTGNYLNITQPSALYLIKQELNNKVDLRFYDNNTCSFHPKAYFFHYDDYSEIYIGSSNISKSALTSGIEWNYRFNDLLDKDSFQKFFMTFEDLFYNHSIIITDEELYRYSKYWRKPAVIKDLEKYKTQDTNIIPLIQPRGVQIEALYALNNSRNEGATKALIHAATGIGKTYLSAFDSANYKRILFVAHREEILKQAVEAFKNVRKSDDYGFFDMQLIDLFKRLDMKALSMKEKIINEYFRIKELLDNKKLTRVELFTYMEDSIYQYCMSHAKENPFRHYLDFLNDLNELSDDEKALYKTIGKDFINLIETTDMQKVYKMPILYAFYNQGNVKLAITDEDVLYTWKAFFNKNKNWKDFADDMTYDKYLKITDNKHLAKAKTMPIKYLKASGKGFFVEKEGFALALNENMKEIIKSKAFVDNMRDVLEYRTIEYYRRRYNMKK